MSDTETQFEDVTFTSEELLEFTPINRVAVDYLMVHQDGSPVWLCMSDEAKKQAIEDLATHMTQQMGLIVPLSIKRLTNVCETLPNIQHSIAQWRDAELEMKRKRIGVNGELPNPRAFFMK